MQHPVARDKDGYPIIGPRRYALYDHGWGRGDYKLPPAPADLPAPRQQTTYACDNCHDTGWLLVGDRRAATRCQCWEQQRRQRIYRESWRIDPRQSRLADFERREGTATNVALIEEMIAGTCAGGFVFGGNGGGKSHLANIIANHIIEQGGEVVSLYQADLTAKLNSMTSTDEQSQLDAYCRRLARVKLLIINEIEPRWTRRQWESLQHRIWDVRYEAAARSGPGSYPLTLFVSNFAPSILRTTAEQLAAADSNVAANWPQFFSRLRDARHFRCVINEAQDYRPKATNPIHM